MKLYIKIFAVLFVALQTSSAFSADKEIDCKNSMTQMDMNICAGMAADKAEKKLNEIFTKLLSNSSEEGRDDIIEIKKSWEIFIDKQCKYNASDVEGGSMYPMEISYCYRDFTESYIKLLEKRANNYRQ